MHVTSAVSGEAHGHDGCNIQVSRLVYNAFRENAAGLVDHREEDHLNQFLAGQLLVLSVDASISPRPCNVWLDRRVRRWSTLVVVLVETTFGSLPKALVVEQVFHDGWLVDAVGVVSHELGSNMERCSHAH